MRTTNLEAPAAVGLHTSTGLAVSPPHASRVTEENSGEAATALASVPRYNARLSWYLWLTVSLREKHAAGMTTDTSTLRLGRASVCSKKLPTMSTLAGGWKSSVFSELCCWNSGRPLTPSDPSVTPWYRHTPHATRHHTICMPRHMSELALRKAIVGRAHHQPDIVVPSELAAP